MLNKKLLNELIDYLQVHQRLQSIEANMHFHYEEPQVLESIQKFELEDFIKANRKPSFSEVLFDFIDKKGVSDSEIYKKAWIDRRHFSKIRSNPDYHIGKNAAIALAFALELNHPDTETLLSAAGYSLSNSDQQDLIIQFFIKKKIFDLHQINQALDYFSLKPLPKPL